METQFLHVEVADHVATVTLDRPPVNAQNTAVRLEIAALFDSFNDRDDVRVAILTAAGRVFCAGADIKERDVIESEIGGFWQHSRRVREAGNSIRECAKPVIAAVNGAALGAGVSLAASCDIIVASEEAVFGMPEIDVGLAGGAALINSMFGKSIGREMFFTGKRLPAAELYRLGVISACVPADQLMPKAREIAEEIASKSPIGMRYAKMSYNTIETMPPRDGYRFEQNMTHALSRTEDAKEAQRAFVEKRKPVFKGR